MIAAAALLGAIVSEVAGTLSLRMAATSSARWYAAVGVAYPVAFALLALALAQGMGIGVAYGIWSAAGVALTALLGKLLFDEPLTGLMGLGIVLIGGGVLLIELGAAP